MHRGGGQIIPTSRRVAYSAFLLVRAIKKTRRFEAIYQFFTDIFKSKKKHLIIYFIILTLQEFFKLLMHRKE